MSGERQNPVHNQRQGWRQKGNINKPTHQPDISLPSYDTFNLKRMIKDVLAE